MNHDFQTVSGLSHVAIRTGSLSDSIRFYTGILGLKEAFRTFREDGTPGAVYLFLAPGQYLELFPGGTHTNSMDRDAVGFRHICLMTKDVRQSYKAVTEAGGRWIRKYTEENPIAGCSGHTTRTEPKLKSWKCLRNPCRPWQTAGSPAKQVSDAFILPLTCEPL